MDDAKWFFLALGAGLVCITVGPAIETRSKNQAKRDALVACFQSSRTDCETIVERVFK